MRRLLLVTAATASCVLLAGCTSGSGQPDTTQTITNTISVTQSTTAPGKEKPIAFATVTPLPPGQAPAAGEVEKACPYIASTPEQNPDVNVADIEGDHVYRTTVLTRMKPQGCRFYFYAGPFEAIADITTHAYANSVTAHNTLVKTVSKDKKAFKVSIPTSQLAYVFRAAFFGQDGGNDWACIFQKGKILVVVRTQQPISFNARALAQAIAPKVK